MSLLNIYVHPSSPSYALVGVDTEGLDVQSGKRYQVGKMLPIVHLNAVLAVRGAAYVLGPIANALLLAPAPFDELLERAGEVFQSAVVAIDDYFAKQGWPSLPDSDQEIALVGWSTSRRRFVGRVWQSETRDRRFDPIDFDSAYIIGGADEQLRSIKTPTNPIAMGELAKVQCRRVRELEPGVAVGGRFIVAWLREDHMKIETVCNLPPESPA